MFGGPRAPQCNLGKLAVGGNVKGLTAGQTLRLIEVNAGATWPQLSSLGVDKRTLNGLVSRGNVFNNGGGFWPAKMGE